MCSQREENQFQHSTEEKNLLVGSVGVDAAAVNARVAQALVDVDGAGGAGKARSAGALVRVGQRRALGAVLARVQGAVVDRLALVAAEAGRTGARVVVERVQDAGAAVLARRRVARVRHGDLAQRRREAERARAREAGHGVGRHLDGAGAAVLAARARPRVTGIGKLAVFSYVLRWATVNQIKETNVKSSFRPPSMPLHCAESCVHALNLTLVTLTFLFQILVSLG